MSILGTTLLATPYKNRRIGAFVHVAGHYFQPGVSIDDLCEYCLDAPHYMPTGGVIRRSGYAHHLCERDDSPTPTQPTAADIELAQAWEAIGVMIPGLR